jgi:hypothetical protein
MQSDNAAEPIEWDVKELKRAIDEWQRIAAQIIELMHDTRDCPHSQNWRPHFQQILRVVQRFREVCRQHSAHLVAMSHDGSDPAGVYECVWHEGHQLVQWLHRMMQQ